MAITVSFDGTVVNASDNNADWAKIGEGGGAPASEAQNAYQNGLAVNNKCTASGGSFSGLEYDPAAGALDMTTAPFPLLFLQLYIADFGDLNATWGAKVWLGDDSANYQIYNLAGSAAKRAVFSTWPNQGGYILTGLNPNIAAWEDDTSPNGAPDLTAVDYFSFQGSMVGGNAKAENLAFDHIAIGRGLLMTGDTPDGTFEDFVDQDQDTKANRWGVVRSASGIFYCVGKLTVGSGTACSFTDTGIVTLVFPDGYVDSGDLGELYDLQHASTDVFLSTSQLIGAGSATTSETRPSLTVSDLSGSFEADGMIRRNYENITFTSVCDVHNVDIECELLVQDSCDIYDSIIRTTAAADVATLQDPVFGTVTDLRNSEFIQAGAGHAILLTGASYDLTGLEFTGYGADGTVDAALRLTNAGDVTLNIAGGPTPTYKYTGGGVVTINNLVTVTLTDLVVGTEIRVYDSGTDVEIDGIESSGASWAFQDNAANVVYIRIFHTGYYPADIDPYEIPVDDSSIPISQVEDPNYKNP